MYFRDGDFLNATTQNMQSSDAAFTIVSWTNVSIEIENSCSVTENNIEETLGFILLEGSRRKDENSATKSQGGVSDSTGQGSLDSLNLEDLDLDLSTDLANPQAFQEKPGKPSPGTQKQQAPVEEKEAEISEELAPVLEQVRDALAMAIGPVAGSIMKETIEIWAKQPPPITYDHSLTGRAFMSRD